ncbi:MAG: DNA polymerase Y family protein [Dehalococcoidia bacterium]
MARLAFLQVDDFPAAVERLDHPALAGQPVVVGGAAEDRKEVLCASVEARAAGIQVGMPLRGALARCPTLVVVQARHARYRELAGQLNRALSEVSPLVEPAELGQAWLGLDGLESLYGDERTIAHATARACQEETGLLPRVGIATGKFTARVAALLATTNQPKIVAREGGAALLAGLPAGYLPIDPQTHRRLILFGLRTIGAVAALSQAALQAQFGPLGARIWRLARGEDDDPLLPHDLPVELVDQFVFDPPTITIDLLTLAARQLLGRMVKSARFGPRAARGLLFRAHLENGQSWERRLAFREPVSDPARMLTALSGKLAAFVPNSPVEAVTIALTGLCAEPGAQAQLPIVGRTSQAERVKEAVGQLKERYLRSPLLRIVEVEPWSRIPERRLALIDFDP